MSDLCDKYQIQPAQFYQWQKAFFENGAVAFENKRSYSQCISKEQRRVDALENKLKVRTDALAELMEEHVQLKKSWRDLKAEWVAHDIRDQLIDFINKWSGEKTGMKSLQLVD